MRPVAGREQVTIGQAAGRVLSDHVIAPISSPPFPNAAMDGYAIRSADTDQTLPVNLMPVGASWAGKAFPGGVQSGQCVRIFTGAALPIQADAVVMQEEVVLEDGHITLQRRVAPGEFVREAGRDVIAGSLVLRQGKRLTPLDIGLIASLGIPEVTVHRRVRVSLLSSGDELQPPGHVLRAGQIFDSNRFALKAFLQTLGVETADLGRLPDDLQLLRAVLTEASQSSDAIVTIGGASVGDADHLVPLLRELGHIDIWKVAVKPGKPFAFGHIGDCQVFGLPGNPVSAIVTFLQIVRPALLRMMGAESATVLRLHAQSGARIVRSVGRLEFQRAVFFSQENGTLTALPLAGQDADRQAPLAAANCFLILPADCAVIEVGEPVTIEPLVNYF